MTNSVTSAPEASSIEPPSRRDFLYLATASVGAVGAAATLWPFIDQMNPDASTVAAGGPVDIDLKQIEPGQQIVVLWSARPVFIANRTKPLLDTLQDPKLVERLSDPNSTNLQQPSYAVNWHRSIKPEYLVLVGICTHLGCIPGFNPQPGGDLGPSWQGGYFCPCHGSRYDLAGRVFAGVPAPLNLPVPPYTFVSDAVVRIGENPPGSNFDLNSVEQL